MEIADREELKMPVVLETDIVYATLQKVRRASKQMDDLNRRLDEHAETNFISLRKDAHPDSGQPALRIDVGGVPEDIPLIVGDILHNFRSALDMLWSSMARGLGGNDSNVAFPIRDERKKLEAFVANKSDCVIAALPKLGDLLLNDIRCYRIGDPPGIPLFAVLSDLDNADKHRLLVTVNNVVSFKAIAIKDKNYNAYFYNECSFPTGTHYLGSFFGYDFDDCSHSDPAFQVVLNEPAIFGVPVAKTPPVETFLRNVGQSVLSVCSSVTSVWKESGRQ